MYKLLQSFYERKVEVEVEVDNIRELEEGLLKNILIKNKLYHLILKGEIIKGSNLIYPILEVDKLEKRYNEKYSIINMSNNKIYVKNDKDKDICYPR